MKVYLAGPMSGIPEHNYPLFHAEAARLRALGWRVVNPAEINGPNSGGWANCMRRDIEQLVTCGMVFTLPGYEGSKGAMLEVHIARELGILVHPAAGVLEPPIARADTSHADGRFLADVAHELSRARAKFPGNTLQMMALTEEVGELAQALIDHRMGKQTEEQVYREAVQVAAMAVRVAVDGDSSNRYQGRVQSVVGLLETA